MLKIIFHQILKRIRQGAAAVTYWDGQRVVYGQGQPYFELTIKHPRALRAMAKNVSLGFGESCMNGDIEIKGGLDQIVRLTSENQYLFASFARLMPRWSLHVNTHRNQIKLVQHHYDLGNDFYRLWLDKSLTYSCAYFKRAEDSLETAQRQKVDYLLKKLRLQAGQTLLDIGSGWGELLFRAAERYGVSGLGITLSQEQYQHSIQAAKERGLADQIQFRLINYVDLAKEELQFDRVISVGMFEHVGQANHPAYFAAVAKLLKRGGVSVLHTISQQQSGPRDAWIDKYIFPGGYLPTVAEIGGLLPEYSLWLEDYENLRIHYAMTLDEWWRRFEANKAKVIKMYDQRFYRMWRLYLASSSASFRYGNLNLSQFVFTKGAVNEPLTREHLYR